MRARKPECRERTSRSLRTPDIDRNAVVIPQPTVYRKTAAIGFVGDRKVRCICGIALARKTPDRLIVDDFPKR